MDKNILNFYKFHFLKQFGCLGDTRLALELSFQVIFRFFKNNSDFLNQIQPILRTFRLIIGHKIISTKFKLFQIIWTPKEKFWGLHKNSDFLRKSDYFNKISDLIIKCVIFSKYNGPKYL